MASLALSSFFGGSVAAGAGAGFGAGLSAVSEGFAFSSSLLFCSGAEVFPKPKAVDPEPKAEPWVFVEPKAPLPNADPGLAKEPKPEPESLP